MNLTFRFASPPARGLGGFFAGPEIRDCGRGPAIRELSRKPEKPVNPKTSKTAADMISVIPPQVCDAFKCGPSFETRCPGDDEKSADRRKSEKEIGLAWRRGSASATCRRRRRQRGLSRSVTRAGGHVICWTCTCRWKTGLKIDGGRGKRNGCHRICEQNL